jgi:hypothetical protein
VLAAIVPAAAHATAGGTIDVRPGTFGLPADATIVEARRLPRRDRALVLWMRYPTRHPREAPDDAPYACPESTRGSSFSGPTRISPLDVANRRLVNTRIVRDPASGADTFDVPYRISRDGPYPVDGAVGRPTLLALRDANGDGTAFEFALFDAEDCVQLDTALFGYRYDAKSETFVGTVAESECDTTVQP